MGGKRLGAIEWLSFTLLGSGGGQTDASSFLPRRRHPPTRWNFLFPCKGEGFGFFWCSKSRVSPRRKQASFSSCLTSTGIEGVRRAGEPTRDSKRFRACKGLEGGPGLWRPVASRGLLRMDAGAKGGCCMHTIFAFSFGGACKGGQEEGKKDLQDDLRLGGVRSVSIDQKRIVVPHFAGPIGVRAQKRQSQRCGQPGDGANTAR